jgi:hypothetical protein
VIPNGTCPSCNDVVNAYKAKNWAYNMKDFAQCQDSGTPEDCYGGFGTKCNSCYDVAAAYKTRGKAFEMSKFA